MMTEAMADLAQMMNSHFLAEEWMKDALCAEVDSEMFFPEGGGSIARPNAVCNMCDVKKECLDFALKTDQQHGIWGGTSYRQRKRIMAMLVRGNEVLA